MGHLKVLRSQERQQWDHPGWLKKFSCKMFQSILQDLHFLASLQVETRASFHLECQKLMTITNKIREFLKIFQKILKLAEEIL